MHDVDVLTVNAVDSIPAQGRAPVQRDPEPGELESMALLATRLEMAAAYLHLIGGR
jgi:hypothetical protein